MKSNLTKLTAAGVLTLSATATAMAGSVTQPGITLGAPAGEPLPPGFYFIDTSDWGVRDIPSLSIPLAPGVAVKVPAKEAVGITAPSLVWSTPWQILGARLMFAAVAPADEVGVTAAPILLGGNTINTNSYTAGMFNPNLGGTLAWQLGGGFAASYTLDGFFGVKDPGADPSGVIEQRFALTYLHNDWNLTANTIYGKQLEQNAAFPDYINLELTAAKTFGKWTLGAVGFVADDLNTTLGSTVKTSEAAVGALVGYNWGPVITEAYVTRDIYQQNLGGYDTRVWGRITVPLGDPFASSPPSSMMYHK
jgi:hypothetical protein